MQNRYSQYLLYTLFLLFILNSCSSPGPGIFGKKTPHQEYEKKIKDAGLKETALGEAWLRAAAITLSSPLDISLPYSETGYFADDRANGIGLRFKARRGQKLKINLTKKPQQNFALYVDLWQPYPGSENKMPKFISAADTVKLSLEYAVTEDTSFIVRIQPELLKEGEYTLTITAGPSLAFPISPKVKSNIGSFWGVGRDNGARKHEGIDIMAAKRSPAVASANGIVTRVNENELGGKVIFLRPENTFYTLYYAHLDSQMVTEGQHVNTGDVIGLVGNTGNAQFTVPHLHFGIYTNSGAIDPLYFVKNDYKDAPKLSVPLSNLNAWMRSGKTTKLYTDQTAGTSNFLLLDENTLLKPEAGTGNFYRVVLPDGKKGFVAAGSITSVNKPIKRVSIKKALPLLSKPDHGGLHKKMLVKGDKINILASFNNFYFVSDKDNLEGWVSKSEL
ncbi:MAG TPA: M23 family metallopeptidase [Chitinophagaceae bacterium]|nr:M23 family metallopeptidase [Chitinophagaceae bacterium]